MSEKPLQNQQEQEPLPKKNTLGRRAVIVGLSALGISALGGGGEILRRNWPDNESDGVESTPDRPADSTPFPQNGEATFEVGANSGSITPLGSSEELRSMAESQPEEFLKNFRITTVNAESPSLVAERIALLFEQAALTAANPTDAADYLLGKSEPEDYKAEAASKYLILAAAGMSGVERIEDINPKPIENSLLFRTLCDLQSFVLDRYKNAADDGSTGSLSFSVASTGHEMTSESSYGIYGMAIDVEATLLDGDSELEVLPATLGVVIRLEDLDDPTEAERAARTRIQAISLKEERTVPFTSAQS